MQETNRFQPLYDALDETNERKQDFHDSVTGEYMEFRHITASGERGRPWDQKTKPIDVYIIPMSMFRALFNQEWTSFHHEDSIKQVILYFTKPICSLTSFLQVVIESYIKLNTENLLSKAQVFKFNPSFKTPGLNQGNQSSESQNP